MIYSPSQTKQYLYCPTARMLDREGWNSRVITIKDWVGWLSQGVHAGLARKHSGKAYLKDAIPYGTKVFRQHVEHALESGRIVPGNLFFASEAVANIERCLEYTDKNDLLPTGFDATGTEVLLDGYSCILDVVGSRNGKPTFIDWKVKSRCKLDYLDQELEKYRYDWKEARHYPWALSQVCGQRVEEYTVVIFVLGPQFRVVQRTYQVNWKMVERWAQGCMGQIAGTYEGTIGLWDMMGEGVAEYEPEPWQSNQCHPAMGFPCEYLDACWTYDLDREKMKHGGLIQVERLKPQTLATSQETEQGGVI